MCRRGWQKLSRFPTSAFLETTPLFPPLLLSAASSSPPRRALDSEISSPPSPPPPTPPLPLSATSSTFPHESTRVCAPTPGRPDPVPVCTCVKSPRRVEDLRVRGRWYQNGRSRTHRPRSGADSGESRLVGDYTSERHTCARRTARVNECVCGR